MTELLGQNIQQTVLKRRNENQSIYRALKNDIIIMSGTDSICRVGERNGKFLGLYLNLTLVTPQVLLWYQTSKKFQARRSASSGNRIIQGQREIKLVCMSGRKRYYRYTARYFCGSRNKMTYWFLWGFGPNLIPKGVITPPS